MNPSEYVASPASRRSQFSSGVNGQIQPANSMVAPHSAAGTCTQQSHRQRKASQPPNKTCGSTFKNPPGGKAWQLIDTAGCRGLTVGAAQVSPLHCNFLINLGGATAADIEELGETVRRRVRETSGVELEWEIKRIGRA